MWISKHNFEWELRQAELKGALDEQARCMERTREQNQEERLINLESVLRTAKTKQSTRSCNCGGTQFHG